MREIPRKAAFALYSLAWRIGLPFLQLNRRLSEGYSQRCFKSHLPTPADLWMQAASVGESFLAIELLKQLRPGRPTRVLVTTNTRQGVEVLERSLGKNIAVDQNLSTAAAYFPFDKPDIMNRAVAHIAPRVAVLLESEIWPAHLAALKQSGSAILVINGRMTERSLKKYSLWPSFWHRLRPDRILAISSEDALRFGRLFGAERVEVMSNIKFDRLDFDSEPSAKPNPLIPLFLPETKLVVLGSIRGTEEKPVREMLLELQRKEPEVVTGLFPRHVERVSRWSSFLNDRRIPWQLRSRIDQPVNPGSVVLWDTFGELDYAYQLAVAAFLGGSLRPLRGQNFLEPLASGIRPVIGPSWEDFHWVGTDIIESGLVRVAQDWKEAAGLLVEDVARPAAREEIRQRTRAYVRHRQGGSAQACRLILEYLSSSITVS
jgi:3-deoxy-D-manno-octulosonic-acid transferase